MADVAKLAEERKKRYLAAMNLESRTGSYPLELFGRIHLQSGGHTFQETYYDWNKNIDATRRMLAKIDGLEMVMGCNLWWATLHDAVGASASSSRAGIWTRTRCSSKWRTRMLPESYDDFIENPTGGSPEVSAADSCRA